MCFCGRPADDWRADRAASLDVRNSTLRSLKLTCPSAEGIDRHLPYASTFTPDAPVMERRGINPFGDADGEWSDEEVLIPRNRRKTQYIPPHIKITASAETSSEESSSAEPSPNRAALQGGRIVPPRMPSRREASTMDASQDDLVQRFHRVTKERDALRRELQRKSMGPNGIPATGSIVFKSEEKTLIEELHAMRHEIRIWTEAYFSGPLSARSKRPHMHRAKELFGCITDNYHVYLKHPEERPLLIQAYVWTRLQQKIFNNWHQGAGYVWAGKLGDKSLRSINDTLRKGMDAVTLGRRRLMACSRQERSGSRRIPSLAFLDRQPPRSASRWQMAANVRCSPRAQTDHAVL